MGRALRDRLHVDQFNGDEEEAVVSLLVAAEDVSEHLERVFDRAGLTGAQFNVLKILKRGTCGGMPRSEITDRMVKRCPDVTRLIDRLVVQGLAERSRSEADRRLSLAHLTPKGEALLEELLPEVSRAITELGKRLTREDCRELSRICECLFTPSED